MWAACTTAAGVRIFGTSVTGFDFSLNYANIPQGASGDLRHLAISVARTVYGDADVAQNLGLGTPVGTFEEGLRRCLNETRQSRQRQKRPLAESGITCTTVLVGRGSQWLQ